MNVWVLELDRDCWPCLQCAPACQPFLWEAQTPFRSQVIACSVALPGKEKLPLVQLKLNFCSDVYGKEVVAIKTGQWKLLWRVGQPW